MIIKRDLYVSVEKGFRLSSREGVNWTIKSFQKLFAKILESVNDSNEDSLSIYWSMKLWLAQQRSICFRTNSNIQLINQYHKQLRKQSV